jgi:hypothetical protein
VFPKLRFKLNDQRFESFVDIQENVLANLRAIPQKAFQQCFRKGREGWEWCIGSGGHYFDGGKAELFLGKLNKFLSTTFGNFPDSPPTFHTGLVFRTTGFGIQRNFTSNII